MEGVFCMKRKRVFSTCGCVLAMGMAISALVLTPKKYTEQEREDAKVASDRGAGE